MTLKHIWIVDNEILYLQLIERYLRETGYCLHTFLSSEDCLASLDKEPPPDLILIDSHMPDIDGYVCCQRVLDAQLETTPFIVLMSGKNPQEAMYKAMAEGADQFLSKPIEKEALYNILELLDKQHDLEFRQQQKYELTQNCLQCAAQTVVDQKKQIAALQNEAQRLLQILTILGEKITFSALLINTEGVIIETFGQLNQPMAEPPSRLKFKNFIDICPHFGAFFYEALHGEPVTYEAQKTASEINEECIHCFLPLHHKGYVLYLALDRSEVGLLKNELSMLHGYVNSGRLTERLIGDFRNILQVISGYTEILQSDFHDQQGFSHLQNIARAVEQARTLTMQMINHLHKPTKDNTYDANPILNEMADFLKHILGPNIILEIHSAQQPCWLDFEVGQFTQVITNLVLNARDSIGDNYGKISISTNNVGAQDLDRVWPTKKSNKDYIKLVIEDNGCGIAPEHLAKIFEPVFATAHLPYGVGLGLSTVYRMIKDQQGVIFCDSEVGHGTTFTLYFERQNTHGLSLSDAANENQYKNAVEFDAQIILIEKDHRICHLLEQSLINYGFRVLASTSYEQVLVRLDSEQVIPDILIADITDMSLEFVEFRDKIQQKFSNITFIYTSSQLQSDFVEEVGFGGAKPIVISKPFHVRELVKVILQALDVALPGIELGS